MAKLKPVLVSLWRGNLRQLMDSLNGAKSGALVLMIAFVIYGWHALQVPRDEAAFRLVLGETSHVKPMFAALFFAFLLIPLILRGGGLDLAAVNRLRRFPFNRSQSFLIAFVEVISAPLVWVLLWFSTTLLPLLKTAPNPEAAFLGYWIFLGICLALMMSVGFTLLLTNISQRKRRQWGVLVVLTACVLYQFRLEVQAYLPHELLVHALIAAQPDADLRWLCLELILAMGLVISTFSILFYEMSCDSGDDPMPLLSRKHGWVPIVRGRWGTFIQMSVIFCYKGIEPFLGLIVSLSATAYLISDGKRDLNGFLFAVALGAVCHAGICFNLFGHEQKGIIRLHLLPIPGAKILLLKNLSAGLVAFLALLPLLLVALLKLGLFAVLKGGLTFGVAMMSLAIWGNRLSVSDPSPRTFFATQRPFLTKAYLTGGVAALIGILSFLARQQNPSSIISLVALNLTLLLFYQASLKREGQAFEQMEPNP